MELVEGADIMPAHVHNGSLMVLSEKVQIEWRELVVLKASKTNCMRVYGDSIGVEIRFAWGVEI